MAGDADVETIKIRKICPVPHTLGCVFLNHKEVTWQTYFKVIYPVIDTEVKVATYTPLTALFRALSAGAPGVASVNITRPIPPSLAPPLQEGTTSNMSLRSAPTDLPHSKLTFTSGSTSSSLHRMHGSKYSKWRRKIRHPSR